MSTKSNNKFSDEDEAPVLKISNRAETGKRTMPSNVKLSKDNKRTVAKSPPKNKTTEDDDVPRKVFDTSPIRVSDRRARSRERGTNPNYRNEKSRERGTTPGKDNRGKSPGGEKKYYNRNRTPGKDNRGRSPGGENRNYKRGTTPGKDNRGRSPGGENRNYKRGTTPGANNRNRTPGKDNRGRSPGGENRNYKRGTTPGANNRNYKRGTTPGADNRNYKRGTTPGAENRATTPGRGNRTPGKDNKQFKENIPVTVDTNLRVFKSLDDFRHKCKNYVFNINTNKPSIDANKPHSDYKVTDYIDSEDINVYYNKSVMVKNEYFENSNEAFLNTVNYLWNYVKMCVMVRIEKNKLHTFYPFVNKDFRQTWGERVTLGNSTNKDINVYLNMKEDVLGPEFEKFAGDIIKDKSRWWCNGSLVDNRTHKENMYGWGDSMLNYYFNLIKKLCEARDLPNCTFFINKRDRPVLLSDDDGIITYPYPEYLDCVDKEMKVGDKFVPIFSPYVGLNSVDIPLPCIDDYKNALGGMLEKSCRDKYDADPIVVPKWKDRSSAAIFRGSATGSVFTDNNQRIKLAMLSSALSDTSILDAGITAYSERDGREYGSPVSFYKDDFNIKVDRMSMSQQCKYKYAIYVQGHSAAGRLSTLLKLGFVVLYVKPTVYSKVHWFGDKLKEFVHYISVESDLSNLIAVIQWCKNNDRICEAISKRATEFYKKEIGDLDVVYDYMQKCIVEACK